MYFHHSAPQVPRSCCKPNSDGNMFNCENSPTNTNSYTKGCYMDVTEQVKQYGLLLGGVGVAIALIMVSVLAFLFFHA